LLVSGYIYILFISLKQHTAIQIQTINIGLCLHKMRAKKLYRTPKMSPHAILNFTDADAHVFVLLSVVSTPYRHRVKYQVVAVEGLSEEPYRVVVGRLHSRCRVLLVVVV